MSSTHVYRPDIDGLRAISILLVVAFHAGLVGFAGGFVGVDVFFVLSGYLITGLLVAEHQRSGRISLRSFFARRLRRLLPLASFVILVTVVAGFWLLPPVQRPTLAMDAVSATFYFANWRFASQATAYSDFAVTDGLLLHYWSLSVEEQFYFVWPILVVGAGWLAHRSRRIGFVATLRLVITILVAVSFFMSVTVTAARGTGAYYVTHTRLWELGAGALLAVWLPSLRTLSSRSAFVVGAFGLGAIGAAAATYDATTAFPGYAALLPVSGAAAVIVAGRTGSNWMSRGLGLSPLPLLGRLSYAWYLWHWPAIGLALLYNSRQGSPWPENLVTAVAVLVSLGLAAASHVVIENPLRRASWLQLDSRSLAFGISVSIVPILATLALLNVRDLGDRPVALPTPVPAGVEALDEKISVLPAPMSPADASEDTIRLGRADCHSAGVDSINVGEACLFGDPDGVVTVALIGDSHAQHWLPALDAAGRSQGWRVLSWTKSSCPGVDVELWDSRSDQLFAACARWYEAVVERLGEERVDTLVLGRSYNYRRMVVTEPGRRPGDLDSDALAAVDDRWAEGLERTFDELLGVSDRVAVLRDTPWSPHDIPSCLSTAAEDPANCAFALDGAAALDGRFHEIERAVAPQGVDFVDLTTSVCETDPCPVVTPGGVIKFSDRHHLTTTFSELLAPALVDSLGMPAPEEAVTPISPMSPAEAADDTTRLGWESCHSGPSGSVDLDDRCIAGDPNGLITVALVGDSHAQHWLPVFDFLGQEHGWKVLAWTKSACPAVDVLVWDEQHSLPYAGCIDWYAAVVDRLSMEPAVDAVVLSRSAGYRGLILGEDQRRLGGAGQPVPPAALAQWRRGVERTFESYLAVAEQVVVLRDTPWSPIDVPSCLSESLGNPDDCAFDLDAAAYRDTELHAVEVDVAPPGVEFIDLTALICPEDPCQVVTQEGVIKYRDRHHLTRTFALRIAPSVGRELVPLVDESS